jgi:hypothetical protein
MEILQYTLSEADYTKLVNTAKEITLETLRKDGILTQEQVDNYVENYALIGVRKAAFVRFCSKVFNWEENKNHTYLKMVKNV